MFILGFWVGQRPHTQGKTFWDFCSEIVTERMQFLTPKRQH